MTISLEYFDLVNMNCLSSVKAADLLVKSVVAIAQKSLLLSYHLSQRSPLFAPLIRSPAVGKTASYQDDERTASLVHLLTK